MAFSILIDKWIGFSTASSLLLAFLISSFSYANVGSSKLHPSVQFMAMYAVQVIQRIVESGGMSVCIQFYISDWYRKNKTMDILEEWQSQKQDENIHSQHIKEHEVSVEEAYGCNSYLKILSPLVRLYDRMPVMLLFSLSSMISMDCGKMCFHSQI